MYRTCLIMMFSGFATLGVGQSSDEKPPVRQASVKDFERLLNREELDRLEAEWASVLLPKYNTNCIAVTSFGSGVLKDFFAVLRNDLIGDEDIAPYYIVDENGMLPRLLGTASGVEESVVLSRNFPGNLLYEFVPPMNFGEGKAYKLVIADDPTLNWNNPRTFCARRSDLNWKAIDLSPEVIGKVCKDGRLQLDFESLESPVPHVATETEEAQHRALANQWEFPIAGEGEVFAASVPRPTMLHVPDSPAAPSRTGIIPVIFGDGRIHAVRAYHRSEDERRLLFSYPCTPTNPGKSGEIGIRPPRRTAYFHLLLRPSGRHAGPDGKDSMLSGWSLYGPYSLETQDGCHPEDVEVPVTREGRPISPEDMRAFQRDGSFPIEIVYE